MLTRLTVKELLSKYEKGVKRVGELATYLRRIETSIGASHIVAWRAEEAVFLEAVVDISQHKHLKNIYEPPAEACTFHLGVIESSLILGVCSLDAEGHRGTAGG